MRLIWDGLRPNGDDRGARSLATGVALIVAGVLPGFLTASLATRIRADFPFSSSTLGLAVAVFYIVSALSSTPAGRLLERIGPVRGMQLSAAFTVASCALVALVAQSAALLMAALVLGGVGNGMGGPTVSALLKREVAAHRQGMAFGAQQAGASFGSLAAGVALPVVAIPFGWRWAFVAAGALALASAALGPRGIAAPERTARAARPGGLTAVHGIAVAAALASAAGVGFISFLVSYSVHSGIEEGTAGLLLAAVSLVAALGRIGLGAIFDRPDSEPLRTLAGMLAAGAGAYLLLITGVPALIAVAALAAGGLGWSWPGGLNLAVVRRSPDAPSWAVGVMLTGLFSGAVAGPLLVGVLADAGAYTAAWGLCATFSLGAAATLTVTRRREGGAPPDR